MYRVLIVLLLAGLAAMATGIYRIKYHTDALEAHMHTLEAGIERDRDAISVLKAEWAYLASPDRLEKLAKKYTRLRPVEAKQIISYETLEAMTPAHGEAVPGDRLLSAAPADPPATASIPHATPGKPRAAPGKPPVAASPLTAGIW